MKLKGNTNKVERREKQNGNGKGRVGSRNGQRNGKKACEKDLEKVKDGADSWAGRRLDRNCEEFKFSPSEVKQRDCEKNLTKSEKDDHLQRSPIG